MKIGEGPAGHPLWKPVFAEDGKPRPFFKDSFEHGPIRKCRSATGVATPDLVETQRALPPPKAQKPRSSGGGGFFSRVGRFFSGVGRRAGSAFRGLVTGLKNTAVGAVKNLFEAGRTLAGGVWNLVTGRFGKGLEQIGRSLVKVVQTGVDALILGTASGMSAIQTALRIEPVGRKLDAHEISALRRVFGESIDYGRVRIKEGFSGVFSLTKRPFVVGDTIYFPGGRYRDISRLIHEMTHVWQHQHGGSDYLSESLWARRPGGEGYEYVTALARGRRWRDLNPEQQAQFLEDAFSSGAFDVSPPRFVRFDTGVDFTAVLLDALHDLRAGRGAP